MKRTYMMMLGILAGFLVLSSHCMAARTLRVTDMAGRQVTVPFDPERIVCIGPGALRLMVYLQAASKIAGVEDMEKMNPGGRPYWIAHPELSMLPRCGPGGPAGINKKPDLEALLAVRPQVIFATYMDASLADEVQRTLNIPLIVLNYGALATFDEAVYDAMRIAGKILNREKRAEEVVSYIESLREDLRMRTRDIPEDTKPTVYIGGIGYRGAHGIESTEQRYIPFDWVGADNVAKKVTARIGSHVAMDKEILLKLNPEVVFIDGGGLSRVREDYRKKPEFYHALKAFSTRRVYTLHPFNWYTTNIGTALADAYAIGKILYEKPFKDIDSQHKADEIYTFLVGKPVYASMQKDYGPIGQTAPFLKTSPL
ncbi:metal ABC transporter, periplasmic metal-binding protein, HemV-2 family [Syntrophotalea carbinolica DSM 2380]|uniref:Metal ABC transporter, periplasmic metal-binding protein, HemV-2 family n=1 Tax=Syntrophotalea carbinolica (strain DSM 2380 / NBRC 103641 / GraBd1) TaxID=338963 RepID=Q3A016_SYNC1|nr:iron ABC transporter substrate-binding protein [Syntrophotalea carbinolica]ABA90291.1 metal ABC transporter, periplasmic metal-binding protein, HemV-2 family [Syntrophotalea carbinolica DSM 2380]